MQKWPQLVTEVQKFKPDFVIIAGDLLPKDSFNSQRAFLKTPLPRMLREMKKCGSSVLLYFGNDDVHTLEPELDKLVDLGLCSNLNERIHRESGLVFVGMPYVRDYPFAYKHWCVPDYPFVAHPKQLRSPLTYDNLGNPIVLPVALEDALKAKASVAERLDKLKGQLMPGEMERSIWMIHQPPYGWGMDLCGNGEAAGSLAVTNFIDANRPLMGISGHIHESPERPGGRWHHEFAPGRYWFQPGQVGPNLHYVEVELANNSHEVLSYGHSIYD